MQPQDDASTAIMPILLITPRLKGSVSLEGQHHLPPSNKQAQFVSACTSP